MAREIRSDGDVFTVAIEEGRLSISRTEPPDFDAAIYTDPATFKALIIDGESRQLAEAQGRLSAAGDFQAIDDLLSALR